jgi:hypothetical protein
MEHIQDHRNRPKSPVDNLSACPSFRCVVSPPTASAWSGRVCTAAYCAEYGGHSACRACHLVSRFASTTPNTFHGPHLDHGRESSPLRDTRILLGQEARERQQGLSRFLSEGRKYQGNKDSQWKPAELRSVHVTKTICGMTGR